MRTYLLSLCLLLALLPAAYAQIGFNSPAGVTPQLDAEIYTNNGFLVQERFIAPPGQQKAIHPFCGSAPVDVSGDLLMSAYAGPLNSLTILCSNPVRCTPRPVGRTLIGVELTVTLSPVATPNNDRIWLRFTTPTGPQNYSFAFPVSASPGSVTVAQTFRVALGPSDDLFRAEFARALGSPAGLGFNVRWQYLWIPSIIPAPRIIPAFRHAFLFDTFRGAFRAGTVSLPDLMAMGSESVALGFENQALAPHSIAFGTQNVVRGEGGVGIGTENVIEKGAVGMGFGNQVGSNASAFGWYNTVNGSKAVAIGSENTSENGGINIGNNNTATAPGAIAIGNQANALGNGAIAMGKNVSTGKNAGAFVIGDSDPSGDGSITGGQSDQFVARFRNGYQLFTNSVPGKLAGVFMSQGQNSWGSISDSTKKERLRPINHAEVLQKINAMKLSSWNYKGQQNIRHYGPMAQDFYAAFGHDGLGQVGCDTLIYSHDFAGVTFAGVQALIRENEQLKIRLNAIENENAQLKADLSSRIYLLERAMLTRRERVSFRKTKP